jgi:hypothetical protein
MHELGLQETSTKACTRLDVPIGMQAGMRCQMVRSTRSPGGQLSVCSGNDVDPLASRSCAGTSVNGSEQLKVPSKLEPTSCNASFRE